MPNERNIDLITVVGVFGPKQEISYTLARNQLKQIEDSLEDVVQIGEIATDRGPGHIIIEPRRQIDLIISDERIEVRQRFPESDLTGSSVLMGNMLRVVLNSLGTNIEKVQWARIGYNFTLTIPTTGKAIAQIENGMFSQEFKDKIKHPIIGAASWLWLTLEHSTMWLRLEPLKSDPASSRVQVNANFTEEEGKMPSHGEFASKLQSYKGSLQDILESINL